MTEHNRDPRLSRRDMLKAGLAGATGMALGNPLRADAAKSKPRATAKSVIQIWTKPAPMPSKTTVI